MNLGKITPWLELTRPRFIRGSCGFPLVSDIYDLIHLLPNLFVVNLVQRRHVLLVVFRPYRLLQV